IGVAEPEPRIYSLALLYRTRSKVRDLPRIGVAEPEPRIYSLALLYRTRSKVGDLPRIGVAEPESPCGGGPALTDRYRGRFCLHLKYFCKAGDDSILNLAHSNLTSEDLLHRSYRFAIARNNQIKVTEIGIHIQSKSMCRNPTRDVHADGRDLATLGM